MLFRDVLVRVSPDYQLELHLDTDEANAAGLRAGDFAVLRKTGGNDLRL
jgi:propanediol utilization protein